MNQIQNDAEFKQALQKLEPAQQRAVAALFVEHVLALSKDQRIQSIIKVAVNSNATNDELSNALNSARAASIDSHTRCGSEGNWTEQAGYFVARAAVAAVTPQAQSKKSGPAWQAAMSSRMAQTSVLIDEDTEDVPMHTENEWQYDILAKYLQL